MSTHQRKPGFLGRLVEERSRRGAAKRRRGRACHRILPFLEILDDRVLLSGNPIVAENQLPGTPESVWMVPEYQSDTALQGFTTDISVDVGQTVSFKITDTTLHPYAIDIYRIGWYGGDGARQVATIPSSQTLAQNQPAPIYNSTTGEWDAGNWAVSASWTVPSTAVSGVYLADLVDQTTGDMSMVVFVVRDDASHSQILFKTDDATWQAYNDWGDSNGVLGSGNSLYSGTGPSSYQGAAYAVSYNRPLNNYNNTSPQVSVHDEFFYAEFPMVQWLEKNGYDVSYFTDVDTDRYGSLILNHQVFTAAGHDEYWSGNEFYNVMAARDGGVDLAFFTGNEVFWKTYYSTSLDSSATADRTLVCYKETHLNAIADPTNPTIWTGTWADPRFSPPADGGIAQNELTGTLFTVNQGADATGTPITVPGTYANLPIWRNTAVAQLASDQSMTIGGQVLGYEWGSDVDNGFRPAGLIDLSSTTQNVPQGLVDWGHTYVPGTATNSQIEYRASSGALVFSASTVQWSWGLSTDHFVTDSLPDPDPNMQQATVNLFADMGVQPGTLQPGLVPATQTALSTAAPTSAITWPPPGISLPSGTPVTITGTASAVPGAFVVGVEVSVDGGQTWHRAQGTTQWTYVWTPAATGPVTIMSRAVDDTVHLETPSSGVTVNVTEPVGSLTLFGLGATPTVPAANDPRAMEPGVRFYSDISGYITGIRFYKGPGNTGTHVGHLWTSTGTLLASVTFTDESTSGWQEADFSTPVAITAGTTYVASYYAPAGNYAADTFDFALSGVNSGPLHVPLDLPTNAASVFTYGTDSFPTSTFESTNYWVDAVFSPTATITPRVTNVSPLPGASGIASNTVLTAGFNESIQMGSLSFLLTDSNGNVVPATVSYNDSTHTATLTPNASLNYPATYTATISGAEDSNGVAMTSSVSWSFNTSYQPGSAYTLWGNSVKPTIVSANDTNPIEVGVDFESNVAGTIRGIRFYDGNSASLAASGAGGITYVVHLWTDTGTLLATANYTLNDDSNLGWQQANFSSPVTIAANTVYVASYYAPEGGYAEDVGYFENSGVTSGPLHAFSNAEISALSGVEYGNGIYVYGTGGGFPTNTYAGTNYWVDVAFNVGSGVAPPPTVTAETPAPGATSVSTATSAISATFNETVLPGSISFALKDASGNSATGSLGYNAATNTIVFTPDAPLALSTQYTVTVSGATDSLGHTMTAPFSWSFTTASTVTYTLFSNTAAPAIASANDPSSYELGVKFESAVPGYLAGLRFYKGSGNTGTHVAHLWTSSGTLLATATFSNETTAGWQEVLFASPVAIAANTVYIASYFAPNGGYAADGGYFTSSGVTSGPLQAPSSATVGGQGVFLAGGGFPTTSFNATNYWVDVDFNPANVNTPPPAVTTQTPVPNTTGIPTISPVSATFSEPVQPNTISFTLTDASGHSVNGTVSYNAATETATFTPSAALATSTQYTATISGVADFYNHTLAAPVTWSFTTSAQPTFTLWNGAATPLTASANDPLAVELGVKFEAAVTGYITGILFYKGASNTGTHAGHLWDARGNLLATATFTNETATGWQQVSFADPVAIAANTIYIASYYAPNGGWAADGGYFAGSGFSSGPLTALSSTAAGGNGVYVYGGGFPTGSYNATNYWIDVDFSPANVNTPPPAVTTQAPASGTTNVSTISPVSVSFSNAIQPGTISFTLADSSGNPVAGSLTYDATSSTATFTPDFPLAISTQYTATVSGALDYYDHTLTAPVSWSFTTSASPTYTLFSNAATPANPSFNDPVSMEPGVKFQSTVTGYISAIRFYKGIGNTGTHVGHLWTSTGTLLATATFTGETTSGWQQVSFANPVAIAADTVYVASYFAPNGKYAADGGYFTSTGVTSGPLQALPNTAAGGNGVYSYGGGFPASSFNATNYWVDVDFTPGTVNTPPPTVTAQTPTGTAVGVSTISSISATFSEPIQPGTISLTLTDGSGNSVSGSLTYDATTETATFSPAAPLGTSTQYTATISGATDFYGNTLAAPVSWSFTTVATATYTLFTNGTTPTTASFNDTSPIELGVKFDAVTNGYVAGIRFYKGPANPGTHVGHLWDASGNLLATATFTNETATGWQQVTFANPVYVTANTVYIASYFAPIGGYAVDRGYFASSGVTSGALHALSDPEANGQGVFVYGGGFPASSFNATNYWVDVMFNSAPPTVVATTPNSAAVGVAPALPVSVTFSEAVQPSTISFVLMDSLGNVLGTTMSYNAATNTVTLTPVFPMALSTVYTATVSGAQDLLGDMMSSSISWSFTTAATGVFTQTTVADFSGGSTSNTTVVANPAGGGEVSLASVFSDDFNEGSLSSGWTTNSWTPAGGGPTSVTLSGGVLSVGGAEVLSAQTVPDGVGVEGSVNFGATPYQVFGMATDLSSLSGDTWAIFSTMGSTNTLFARVNVAGTTQDVSLGLLPAGFHDYLIQPVAGGIQFSVDGVALTTISLTIPGGTPLAIAISSFNGAPQPALQVDWARMTSYATSGMFTSSVFDAGSTVNWGTATWAADLPVGTTITVLTSSSTDGTNWSDWSTVTNGGTITSPNGRYLRYEVLFTTTDPTVTATLSGITFTWN